MQLLTASNGIGGIECIKTKIRNKLGQKVILTYFGRWSIPILWQIIVCYEVNTTDGVYNFS